MWWALGFPLMSCLSCSPAITVNQGEMGSPQRVTSSQQQTRISASSATRELDELMASLSDFKVPQGPSSSLTCSFLFLFLLHLSVSGWNSAPHFGCLPSSQGPCSALALPVFGGGRARPGWQGLNCLCSL